MKKIFSYCAVPVAAIFGLYLNFSGTVVNAGDVQKVYKDTCELCHGADGKGSEAGKQFGVPDFTNSDYQKSRTDAQMKESMVNGTKNPNYVKLSDLGVDVADIDGLVGIVRGFNK